MPISTPTGEFEEVADAGSIPADVVARMKPWGPGRKAHWVRIRGTDVTGRRLR